MDFCLVVGWSRWDLLEDNVSITAWIIHFVHNCKEACRPVDHTWDRQGSPLVGEKSSKEGNMGTEKFKQDQLSLNLQKNSKVCLNEFTCVGHQMQYYQIRIQDTHVLTLHRGVGLTMTYIRHDYWISDLRHLKKKGIHGALDVKGFRLQPFNTHRQEICQLNALLVQFPSKSWVWIMPVQFQTRPVPREKLKKPTSSAAVCV